MFRKVRKQLTIFNSVLMGSFLLLFTVITYVSLAWNVYSQIQNDVLDYAKEEAAENLALLKAKTYLRPDFIINEAEKSEMQFFYVFNNHGKLVHSSAPHSGLPRMVNRKIAQGNLRDNQPALITFKHSNHHFRVMLTTLPIKDGPIVYGRIYVGKNVTNLYQIFLELLYTFALLLVVFLFLTTLAGFIMAGKAMAPIKRSYEQQREFLADASHELRTPLSVLLSSVDAIQGDEQNQVTPFSQQVLADMRDEIKKMTKIVSDLLTLARSDGAVLNLMKKQFDLIKVAEQTMRIINPLAQSKSIELRFASPQSIIIYADEERIAQLLLILLDNAVKYTPEHGQVQLLIQQRDQASTEIEMVVQDNGIGIAPAEQARIFERFYRVDKARSRTLGGTGLGLPIAKWIAEQHGGSIKVISQPGQGSCFVVTLPGTI